MSRRHGTCRRCKRVGEIVGRKLCGTCHAAVSRAGKLIDYPRSRRTPEELVEEVEHLSGAGVSMQEMADRLGYASVASLEARLRAARRRAYVAALEAEVRFLRTRVAELQTRVGVR